MAEKLTKEDEEYLANRGQGVDAPASPAPPPDPAAPTEQAATPQPASQPEPQARMVPVGELAQERERRRRAEETARQERLERERLAGRVDEIARRMGQSQQPAPPAPAEVDIDADPVAALKAERAARKQLEADNERRRAEQQATTEQQQQIQAIQTRYAASARDFARDNPDWDQAYHHFVQTRERAYIALGYSDPVERQNLLNRDEIILAARAFHEGANPAERLYAAAAELGYRKPAPAAAPPLADNGVTPAAPAAPAPQQPQSGAPRMPTEAERLAALQRGSSASTSLGQSGGNAPASSLTLESMLKMSEEDFNKIPPIAFEKAMMAHYDKLPRQ